MIEKRKALGYSLNMLYKGMGISKQAVHQYLTREKIFEQKLSLLLTEVNIQLSL